MQPSPDLILQQPARYQRLSPKRGRRAAILGQQMRERYGRIEVDQRALLSSPSSARSSCNGATAGGVGGGADEVGTGGVSQPFRTASASTAPASNGLLVAYGGPSSATIRSRSVIRTVSPDAATRTYSLSLLFRTFMPTDLMKRTVTPRCYLVKVVRVVRVVIRGIQAIQWTGPRQCHGMPAQRRQFRGRRVQETPRWCRRRAAA